MPNARRRWGLAALPVTALWLAGCASPFKGEDEPPPPSEQTGWEVGHSDATIPTQQEMDQETDP